MTERLTPDERCEAVLKYIYRWRCRRRAVEDGLCRQHRRVGCQVPERWVHEVNGHGVEVPTPILPFRRIAPAPLSARLPEAAA